MTKGLAATDHTRITNQVKSIFPDCVSLFSARHPFTGEERLVLVLESVKIEDTSDIRNILEKTDLLDFKLVKELELWPYNESPLLLRYYAENNRVLLGEDLSDEIFKVAVKKDYHDASFSNLIQSTIHIRKSFSRLAAYDEEALNRFSKAIINSIVFGCSSQRDFGSNSDVVSFMDACEGVKSQIHSIPLEREIKEKPSEESIRSLLEDSVWFAENYLRTVIDRNFPKGVNYERTPSSGKIIIDDEVYQRALVETLDILNRGIETNYLSSVILDGSTVSGSYVPGWSDLDIGVIISQEAVSERHRLLGCYNIVRRAFLKIRENLDPLRVWQHTFNIYTPYELPYLDQWYWNSLKKGAITLAGEDYISNLPNMLRLDREYIQAKFCETLWGLRKYYANWDRLDWRSICRFFTLLHTRPMSALFCLGMTVTKDESYDLFESCFDIPLANKKLNMLKEIRSKWPDIRDNGPLLKEYARFGLEFAEEMHEAIIV